MAKLRAVVPVEVARKLVHKVEAEAKAVYDEAGDGLPKLVLLPRTGYEVGPIIAREWGIDGVDILHASLKREGDGTFRYGQMPLVSEVEGQSLLVVDGVCKSGETLSHVVDLLKLAGAGVVKSAVMMHKPNETTTGYVPDFVGEVVTDGAFYIFPWERDEYLPVPPGALEQIPPRGRVVTIDPGTVLRGNETP